jgi:nucleotide-binding universal stress UspA family protein
MIYRRMLVPLDGSKLAEETFPYARELAARLNLDLDFLHVLLPTESRLTTMSQVYVDTLAVSAKEQIQKIQTTNKSKGSISPIRVRSKVVTGYPAEEILKYSEENAVDIILMATHGNSGVRRWALGSVAYQVLHASNIPVLLIRSGIPDEIVYDQWPQKTLLVPLDGSELAESALPHAKALANQRGLEAIEVLLLSAYEPVIISPASYYLIPTDVAPGMSTEWEGYVKEETAKAKEACEKYLSKIADQFKSVGIKVRTEAVLGKAAEEIIKYADKNPFQLIVMASHGRSGIKHFTFGSITERILLEVSVPVFIVIPSSRTNLKSALDQNQDDEQLAEIETIDEDRDL